MQSLDARLVSSLYGAVLEPDHGQHELAQVSADLLNPELTTAHVPSGTNEDRAAYGPTPIARPLPRDHRDARTGQRPARTIGSPNLRSAQDFHPTLHADAEQARPYHRDTAGISALLRDAGETRCAETLLPHLGNCLAIQRKLQGLESRTRLLETALDSLRVGILIVAPGGEILHSNAQAEAYFHASCPLLAKQGRLHARQPVADRRLCELLVLATGSKRCAGGTQAGTLTLTTDGQRAPVRVLVAPLYGTSPPAPAVVLLSKDEVMSHNTAQFVLQGMNLTPTEIRCAALLAQGHSIDDIAQRLPARRNTVRCHLRNMFLKTGVKTQTALVAMLHRQIAAFDLAVAQTMATE